jgi:hypothetical protein
VHIADWPDVCYGRCHRCGDTYGAAMAVHGLEAQKERIKESVSEDSNPESKTD